MGLKGTFLRFVALFGLLLALGVVSSHQATIASASSLASFQETEGTDDTTDDGTDDDGTDDTDDGTEDDGTDDADDGTDDDADDGTTESTGTATGTGTTLPDTGAGVGMAQSSGGLMASMLSVAGLLFMAAAIVARRRANAPSGS